MFDLIKGKIMALFAIITMISLFVVRLLFKKNRELEEDNAILEEKEEIQRLQKEYESIVRANEMKLVNEKVKNVKKTKKSKRDIINNL